MTNISPHSSVEEVQQASTALGPWVTSFQHKGVDFGGNYPAEGDDRITLLLNRLSRPPKRILECACLEGGHTSALARNFPEASITAVDGRAENLARAKFLCALRGHRNVTFQQIDLEFDFVAEGEAFDFILCMGLLYHLRTPRRFIERLAARTNLVWVWTQVCHDQEVTAEVEGEFGRIYHEPAEHPLNGLRDESFFPTLGSLARIFADAGLPEMFLARRQVTPNGPAILAGFSR